MELYTHTLQKSQDDISQLIAQKLMRTQNTIFPFADYNEFLKELFSRCDRDGARIVSIGPAGPDIAIAADQANLKFEELIGHSPFSYSLEDSLDRIQNGDIIYIANPNKISGANCSLSGLKKIMEKNKNGIFVIDEFYFDFFGISGLPLLDLGENVVILRSFAAPFGVYSSDAGYAVATKKMINDFNECFNVKKISSILRKTIFATVVNEDALRERLQEIHNESLRLTKALNKLGVQCRITATDFLLLRVASPKDVGNVLAKSKIEVDNLDGYPLMKKYLRYRIGSYFTNDRLIRAFEHMSDDLYKIKTVERRKMTLHKPQTGITESVDSVDEILNSKIIERSKPVSPVEDKHLFKITD